MKKILFLLALLAAFHVNANLISNGSFETANCSDRVMTVGTSCTNNLVSGQWVVLKNLSGGWTTVSGSGIEIRDNVSGIAQNGSNFVELDSHGNPGKDNTYMQQVFSSPTANLDLSFWYAARPGTAANTNGISVFFNGLDISSSLVGGPFITPGSTNTKWIQYTAELNGLVGNNVLGFKAVGKDDTYGGSLDNVSVTAVPEPSTIVVFLTGIIIIWAIYRARKTTGRK